MENLTIIVLVAINVIILILIISIYGLIKKRQVDTNTKVKYQFSSHDIGKEINKSTGPPLNLDPHEIKLMRALFELSSSNELTVSEVNELLNLNKLSKENQRQRRHIIFKELNLKLFLLTGNRESIKRISTETDRRVKFYSLAPELEDYKLIKELIC